MYLKKIIAQGFKSLADKITIDLENNILYCNFLIKLYKKI